VGGTAAGGHEGSVESSHGAARTHVLLSLAAGVVAAGVSTLFTTWQIAVLIGWDMAAVVFMAWIRLIVGGMDSEATARHAAIEDASRPTADLILILASVTSLIAVGLALLEASRRPGLERAIITAVAAITVILSWATVHTVFTLRYARLYYAAGGGSTSTRTARPRTATSRTSPSRSA
jgi:uncharacterized membrane protein